MEDLYRGNHMSVIIQPKLDNNIWSCETTAEEFEKNLMFSNYPIHTEIIDILKNLKVLTVNNKTKIKVEKFVFGTETGEKTKIPHYQIYLQFKHLVRSHQVFKELEKVLNENNVEMLVLKDSVLIPVTMETTVRLVRKFPFNFQYRYSLRLQDKEDIDRIFYKKSYYPELLENIRLYKEYIKKNIKKNGDVDSFVINSEWMAGSPVTAPQDVVDVHTKALFYASAFVGDKNDPSDNYVIQSSSFKNVKNKFKRMSSNDIYEKNYDWSDDNDNQGFTLTSPWSKFIKTIKEKTTEKIPDKSKDDTMISKSKNELKKEQKNNLKKKNKSVL